MYLPIAVCYLSSGKPAVVQHTGSSSFLPDADGLFRFRSLEEAARALDTVQSDYERRGEANASLHQVYIKRSNALTNESVGPEEEEVYHLGDQQLANLLKQGVTTWNDWRREHSTLPPELSRADLSRAILNNADLSRANLSRANLLGTDLSGANLSRAHLAGANLINANLSGANLKGAYLIGTKLHGANLSRAILGLTIIANVDLSAARGLDEVNHLGPSSIGMDTIYRSKGTLPDTLLRGAGLPDNLIVSIAALGGHPGDASACFIRYSLEDQPFAQQLHADLQRAGIRCWLTCEEGKTEDKDQLGHDKALSMGNTRLLVLSRHSVESAWVKQEIHLAFARELQQKRLILFPIWLDETAVMSHIWASPVHKMRRVGDFTHWTHPADYQKAFAELFDGLKTRSRNEGI